MNPRCEQAVSAMTTGGMLRRWWAYRHAGRCPRCAAVRDELQQIVGSLADAPPLTAAERRLWAAAAGDEAMTVPRGFTWSRPVLAGTMAAAIVAAACAWWMFPPVHRPDDRPPVVGLQPQPGEPSSFPEVESLRGSVVALALELDDLGRRAELLDARREVDALMARLAPPVSERGL